MLIPPHHLLKRSPSSQPLGMPVVVDEAIVQPATGLPIDSGSGSTSGITTGLPASSSNESSDIDAPPLTEASTEDHDPLLPTLTEGQRAGEYA